MSLFLYVIEDKFNFLFGFFFSLFIRSLHERNLNWLNVSLLINSKRRGEHRLLGPQVFQLKFRHFTETLAKLGVFILIISLSIWGVQLIMTAKDRLSLRLEASVCSYIFLSLSTYNWWRLWLTYLTLNFKYLRFYPVKILFIVLEVIFGEKWFLSSKRWILLERVLLEDWYLLCYIALEERILFFLLDNLLHLVLFSD